MAILISIGLVISIAIFVLCLVVGVYGFFFGIVKKSVFVVVLSLILVTIVPATALTLNYFSNRMGTVTHVQSK